MTDSLWALIFVISGGFTTASLVMIAWLVLAIFVAPSLSVEPSNEVSNQVRQTIRRNINRLGVAWLITLAISGTIFYLIPWPY